MRRAEKNAPRNGTLFGQLFESLVTQSVPVYAQAAEATVHHLCTEEGRHEVDLIVERGDHRVIALEVKLSSVVNDDDVVHLLWPRDRLKGDLLDAAVITTGLQAYRRRDGIAVIPASAPDHLAAVAREQRDRPCHPARSSHGQVLMPRRSRRRSTFHT